MESARLTDVKAEDIDLENLSFRHDLMLPLLEAFESKILKGTVLWLLICKPTWNDWYRGGTRETTTTNILGSATRVTSCNYGLQSTDLEEDCS